MNFTSFVSQHSTVLAMVSYYVFSVMVSSMAEPSSTSSPAYQYAYKVFHAFAGILTQKFGPVPSSTTTTTTTSVVPAPVEPVQK